jgi:hypothetical protein
MSRLQPYFLLNSVSGTQSLKLRNGVACGSDRLLHLNVSLFSFNVDLFGFGISFHFCRGIDRRQSIGNRGGTGRASHVGYS